MDESHRNPCSPCLWPCSGSGARESAWVCLCFVMHHHWEFHLDYMCVLSWKLIRHFLSPGVGWRKQVTVSDLWEPHWLELVFRQAYSHSGTFTPSILLVLIDEKKCSMNWQLHVYRHGVNDVWKCVVCTLMIGKLSSIRWTFLFLPLLWLSPEN